MKFIYVAIIQFVLNFVKLYDVDESHGVMHSLKTFKNANTIYDYEVIENPYLEKYKDTILISSLLHDTADSKYVNTTKHLLDVKNFLNEHVPEYTANDVIKIISQCSYGHIKKNGYPKNLGELKIPFDIVREADLLQGYDFERALTYALFKINDNITLTIDDTIDFFNGRVLSHEGLYNTHFMNDNIFIFDYITGEYLKEWKKINS